MQKLSPGSVTNHLCALRFFYIQTLIPMSTALFPPAGSRSITAAGFDLTRASFSPFPCSGRCFAASSSRLSSWPFSEASCTFPGIWRGSRNPNSSPPGCDRCFGKNWVVYSKPPFGGPEYVLHYLGRYTHRVAISNHRLVSLADGQVTFRWRDSADHNQQKLMTVSLDEFLRRFLLHLLPKGFVRIRHFGFLANRRRSTLLPLCFAALGTVPVPMEPETTARESQPLWRCPKCGGPMAVIERLTAAQIQLRSPPRLVTTAT